MVLEQELNLYLCPTCGQALPKQSNIKLDLGFLFVNGKKISVSPKEQRMLFELIEGLEQGRAVSGPQMLFALYEKYGDEAPPAAKTAMSVYISRLRTKLEDVDCFIQSKGRREYRLIIL